MGKVRVVVEADIRPTESEEKVKKALLNIIDPETVSIEGESGIRRIVMTSSTLRSLEKLRYMLRAERILDAARKAMRRGVQGDRLVFYLHKQALYVGRLSFVGGDAESPMGAVRVTVEHPDPKRVIDWLAPPTVRGRPIFEIREPPE
ncbi:MAG: hypothetical protein F7C35_00250 [Desulfurococcales archaeon]|nr:hypothetical protein [Desulfurococcales archaeon]